MATNNKSNDKTKPKKATVKIVKKVDPPIDISQFSDMSLDELADVLSLTIKHDKYNKVITMLCMLSTYTANSQINISFNAQSSSGKTYTVIEIAKFFPKEDKIVLSGASPTAFFYKNGVQDKKRKAKIVKLDRKILIFLELPNPQLQAKLRSLLSHDEHELHYLMTNKDKKGSNRAELVILEGWPATVFCSASMQLDEQETTRAILLSPEVTEDKLKAGVHLQAERGADEAKFDEWLESNPERKALKLRILAIKQANVKNIIIQDVESIEQRFNVMFPKLKPRNMRDIHHLMQLIKAIALFNVWFRLQQDGTVVANKSDIDEGFKLWEELAESQNMNVPPAVMNFYKEYVLPAHEIKANDSAYKDGISSGNIGVSRQEVAKYYLRKNNTMLNDDWFRKQVLPQLQNGGLIDIQQPSEGDKRSYHIFPIWFPGDKDPVDPDYIGMGGGGIPQELLDEFFGTKKET